MKYVDIIINIPIKKTKVFLQKRHWNSQKAEKQIKNRTKICNLTKQVKATFPAENMIYDDVSKNVTKYLKSFFAFLKVT